MGGRLEPGRDGQFSRSSWLRATLARHPRLVLPLAAATTVPVLLIASAVIVGLGSAFAQTAEPGLTISKTADALVVPAGDPIGYRIDVSNTQAPGVGTIVIENRVTPHWQAFASPFTYTGDAPIDGLGLGGSGERTFAQLFPGAYEVRLDQLPEHFEFVELSCSDGSVTDQATRTATIDLDENETVRCVFTSREQTRGTIVIENRVTPHWQAFASPFTYTGDAPIDGLGLGGSGERTFAQLFPGAYEVRLDQLPEHFEFVELSCSDGSVTDQATRTATIDLDENETVRCVFTSREQTRGTIVIENRVTPHWQAFASPFTYTGDAPIDGLGLGGSSERTFAQLFPGAYEVRLDQLPEHFEFVELSCSDGSVTDQATRTATIDLDENETVRCVFTSREQTRGTIVIENRVTPHWQAFASPFTYTGDAPIDGLGLGGSSERTFPQLFPGAYEVRLDQLPEHFEFVELSCSDGSVTDQATRTATIDLDENETVRCVFTSREQTRGTIVIENRVTPHWQAFASPFTYTGDAPIDGLGLGGSSERTFPQLFPGAYEVRLDQLPEHFEFVDLSCSDGSVTDQATRTATIDLDENETVRCVFTSREQTRGTIVIENRVTPHWQAFASPFTYTGDAPIDGLGLGGSSERTFAQLFPGAYEVRLDQLPEHFEFVELSCSDGSVTDQSTRTATIDLDENETVRCVFTSRDPDAADDGLGTIIIEKQGAPDSLFTDQATFESDITACGSTFALFPGGELVCNIGLAPGTYHVTEDEPTGAGDHFVSLDCDDANSIEDQATRTATIHLEEDETVRCVFTDTAHRGTIIIEKQGAPDSLFTGEATFESDITACGSTFALFPGGELVCNIGLAPGTYHVTEDEPTGAGDHFVSLDCDDANSIEDQATRTATIHLEEDETVRCVFTDTAHRGTIIIEKQGAPDSLFTGEATFESDITACGSTFALFPGGELVCNIGLAPGTYHVTEDEPTGAGDHFVSLDCDDANSIEDQATRTATIHLEEDETVRCVFTDTAHRGTIIIEKQGAPDSLFTGEATFESDITACGSTFALFPGGELVCNIGLAPGTYHVTEDEPTGAGDHFVSLDCDDANSIEDQATRTATIHLEEDETVRCVFTDTAHRGTIIIEKQGAPDSLFTGEATFESDITACGSTFALFPGGELVCNIGLAPGTYHVTEDEPTGAGDHFVSLDCDDANSIEDQATRTATIHLEEDETVRCVFTDTAHRGTIIIEKQGAPDSLFTGEATFESDITACGSTFALFPGGELVCNIGLAPGTYHVTEDEPTGAGDHFVSLDCDDANSIEDQATRTATIHLEEDETVRCVFVNAGTGSSTANNVTLTDELPSGPGIQWSMDPQVSGCSIAGGSLSCAFGDLRSGESVSVHLTSPTTNQSCGIYDNTAFASADNFSQVQASASTMVIDCPAATLVVEKQTLPDGDPTEFAFTGDATGTIGDGETITVADLEPGRYTVFETVPAGWDLSDITCSDTDSTGNTDASSATFQLSAGETVRCIFTDARRGTVDVLKTVQGAIPTQLPGSGFTFELRTGASSISAGQILESMEANNSNGGAIDFATSLVAGDTYALCELLQSGWATTFAPPAFVTYNPGGASGIVCTDFSVGAGETREFSIDNTPSPTEEPPKPVRTWKKAASCGRRPGNPPLLDQALAAAEPAGVTIGDLVLHGNQDDPDHATDCQAAVRILGASRIDTGEPLLSDPAFKLAAQLLASRLNVIVGATACPEAALAIGSAQSLLEAIDFDGIGHAAMTSDQARQAKRLAGTLVRYNEDELC